MHARRRFIAGIAGAALTSLAGGCRDDVALQMDTLDRVRQEGRLRIGYANESPYAYFDLAARRVTGEAPEIARTVLADMDVREVEGVLAEFGALIPGLKARRFDVIAAGMYILPERCREIAFSNPTCRVGEAFMVAKGNPGKLHGYADMVRRTDVRLAVVAGAVQRSYARSTGVPDERVIIFPDTVSAMEGIAAGRAEAYAATSATVNDLLARGSGKVERAEPFEDLRINGNVVRGYGAFGFRREDAALLAVFNEALSRLIGTPRHLELVRSFGFTENEFPDGATAAALCAA